jgi:Nif-specific regulatory protein
VSATPTSEAGVSRTRPVRSAEIALAGVYEISKLLTSPNSLEMTLAGALNLLSNFMDMRHGLIALLGKDGSPEVVVGTGWSEATAKRYFERLPERAIGRIVVTQTPLVIEHMKSDPLFESWSFSEWGAAEGDSSFIGVPVKDRGQVIGTLTIDREMREQPYFLFDDDVRFLTMVANLLGQAIRLQRLIARDRERLMGETRRLEKAIEHGATLPQGGAQPGGIIGQSAAIRTVFDKVGRVARSHSPVLLRGESGTGKEMFAKALHDLSPRNKGPFVAVNCAALAESVLESELFGHEKGSFTGAASQRKGRFEVADGGTLFLDEIGEISRAFQAKLLRVLQLGEFERVGGSHTVRVDVRLVAATNRNLEEAVARGEFRADLYYRVSVVPIFLPPLRDRKEDIPQLAREFLRRFNAEHVSDLSLTESAIAVLEECCFPGNVRELKNCVRRTATLAHGTRIVADDFACRHDECMSSVLWNKPAEPANVGYVSLPIPRAGLIRGRAPLSAGRPESDGLNGAGSVGAVQPPRLPVSEEPAAAEADPGSAQGDGEPARQHLIETMETAGWVQAKAARLLGITARQVGYALRKHGIDVKKF